MAWAGIVAAILDETLPPEVTLFELGAGTPVLWEKQWGKVGRIDDVDCSGLIRISTYIAPFVTWRLKEILLIETSRECGGPVRTIACIEDPVAIEGVLTHLDEKGAA